MLENKVRNQERQMSVFNTAAKSGSEDGDSDGSEQEYGNRKYYALTRQGKSNCSNKA